MARMPAIIRLRVAGETISTIRCCDRETKLFTFCNPEYMGQHQAQHMCDRGEYDGVAKLLVRLGIRDLVQVSPASVDLKMPLPTGRHR